jgi:hypothetical protein
MTPEQRWRMCLIHMLALGDKAHSEIIEMAQACPAASGAEDNLALVLVHARIHPNAHTHARARLHVSTRARAHAHKRGRKRR